MIYDITTWDLTSPLAITVLLLAGALGTYFFEPRSTKIPVWILFIFPVIGFWLLAAIIGSKSFYRKETWLNSSCAISSNGWRALLISSYDGKAIADRAVKRRDHRFMFAYFGNPTFTPYADAEQSQYYMPGLACNKSATATAPPGIAIYGDFVTSCVMFYRGAQECLAFDFNRHLFRNMGPSAVQYCEYDSRAGCEKE